MQSRVSLPVDVHDLYSSHIAQGSRPTRGEISKCLQSEIKIFSRIFIIVDALDECPEDKRSRAILLNELRALQPKANLMVTSRFLDNIACEFAGITRIEISASIEDLQTYTKGRIFREDRLLEHIQRDPALEEEITKTVVRNARQMSVTSFLSQLLLIDIAETIF